MPQRRPVVQVIAHLKNEDCDAQISARRAMLMTLNWLRNKQRISIPASADSGESFEVDITEGQPVTAIRLDGLWALQFDKLDSNLPGRIWRTEVSVGHTALSAIVGVRLAVVDTSPGHEFVSSVPRLVGDLIESPGLHDYGVTLSNSATLVEDTEGLDRFLGALYHSNRSRPLVLFSELNGGEMRRHADDAARRLAGIAHVYSINTLQSRNLSEETGRHFSAWNGAVRTYFPQFDSMRDDIFQHPLSTQESITFKFHGMERFVSMLARSFALRSVRDAGVESLLPSFRAIKQDSLHQKLSRIPKAASANSEREELLQMENELFQQAIEEKETLFSLASEELKKVESERNLYRSHLSSMRAQIDALERRSRETTIEVIIPDDLEKLEQWTIENCSGRLVLLPKAAKAARKSLFSDPKLIYKCLSRLAGQYSEGRRNGTPVVETFQDLGVHLERTGDPARLAKWENEYFVNYRGKRQFLEWHLKKGVNKSELTTLRIYFFYDDDDGQVVVGHLPSHLTNEYT